MLLIYIKMATFDTISSPKLPKYFCEQCDIKTNNKKDYNNHILTRKHKQNVLPQQIATEPSQNSHQFKCVNCEKDYESRSGLWRHNKICNGPPVNNEIINENNVVDLLINENKDFKNLILELVKSNTDLQSKMMDMCKNSNNTTINNNNKNSNNHNKTFNMQIFLNEHCKDAMNIKDFADSFELQISDLEKVGQLGYVDGISDIIIKKLNEMDVYKRPIHCSDTKRDTVYVHADNIWTKETSDHDQVRMLVQRITAKNIRLLPIWREMYPNCKNNMHRLNETYLSLTRQAMGGFGGTIPENESKIIRKIAKTVYIDKNM
jgi:hypothetical protein